MFIFKVSGSQQENGKLVTVTIYCVLKLNMYQLLSRNTGSLVIKARQAFLLNVPDTMNKIIDSLEQTKW